MAGLQAWDQAMFAEVTIKLEATNGLKHSSFQLRFGTIRRLLVIDDRSLITCNVTPNPTMDPVLHHGDYTPPWTLFDPV
ncbi:unnamed protein product [Lota lota]